MSRLGGLQSVARMAYHCNGNFLYDANSTDACQGADEGESIDDHGAPHLTKDIDHHPLQCQGLSRERGSAIMQLCVAYECVVPSHAVHISTLLLVCIASGAV